MLFPKNDNEKYGSFQEDDPKVARLARFDPRIHNYRALAQFLASTVHSYDRTACGRVHFAFLEWTQIMVEAYRLDWPLMLFTSFSVSLPRKYNSQFYNAVRYIGVLLHKRAAWREDLLRDLLSVQQGEREKLLQSLGAPRS